MPIYMHLPELDGLGSQPPSDQTRGAPSVSEIVVTKTTDATSPLLFNSLASGPGDEVVASGPGDEIVASGPGDEAERAQDEVGIIIDWMGGDGAPGEASGVNAAFCDGHTSNPVASGPGDEAGHAQDEVGLIINWMGGDGAPGEDVMCQNNLRTGDDFIIIDFNPTESLKADDNFIIIEWLAEDHGPSDPSDGPTESLSPVDPSDPSVHALGGVASDFLLS